MGWGGAVVRGLPARAGYGGLSRGLSLSSGIRPTAERAPSRSAWDDSIQLSKNSQRPHSPHPERHSPPLAPRRPASRRIPHSGQLIPSRERDASNLISLIPRLSRLTMAGEPVIPRPARFMTAIDVSFPRPDVLRDTGNGAHVALRVMHI